MDSISGKNVGRIIGMQVWSAPAGFCIAGITDALEL
jgi:hypothetical protein